MMKKLLLLIPAFLLAGCVTNVDYIPSFKPTYTADPEKDVVSEDEEATEDDELTCTYNFYFSYSHTTKYSVITGKDESCPIYTCKHSMLSPLGAIPDAVKDEASVVALGTSFGFSKDPAFKTFLGFSSTGVMTIVNGESKDDEGKLWNFATDYKQEAIINLYGIWVD